MALLREAIESLECSERALLKTRAVLEARVQELEAALAAARAETAAAADATQLAVASALAGAHTQLQQEVSGAACGHGGGCGGQVQGGASPAQPSPAARAAAI